MGNIELLRELGNYAVLAHYKADGTLYEYVVARNYNRAEKVWDSGDYFTLWNDHLATDIICATRAYDMLLYRTGHTNHTKGELEEKLKRQTIPYDRLVELATRFKDGIFEATDSEAAKEYIYEEMDLDSEERKFFGLSRKFEIYEVTIEQTISRKIKVAVPEGYGEAGAEDAANEVFEDINLDSDNEVEYGTTDARVRFLRNADEDDVDDVENDIEDF